MQNHILDKLFPYMFVIMCGAVYANNHYVYSYFFLENMHCNNSLIVIREVFARMYSKFWHTTRTIKT